MMQVREMNKDEQREGLYLVSQAFMRGSRDYGWIQDPNTLPFRAFGVWDDRGLQAQAVVIQYHVHLGPDVVVPMGGIAGVACLPASRGKGYAAAALRMSLEAMRDAGQVVSTLFPFSFEYYQRLGWEWVGLRRSYTLSTRILPPSPEADNLRAARAEDRDLVVGAYTAFAGRYRGMVARCDKEWNRILDDTDKEFTYTYLYERDGAVEGYLTYRGGEDDKTRLRELIALTPRAYSGLLALLRRHEMQMRKVAWDAPGDDALWSHVYHWDIETNVRPKTMGRVVDVPAALQAWKPARGVQGRVRFEVRDEAAPWNQAVWLAECEGGEVRVARTEGVPDVSLGIQALSQAYFGTPTLDELRRVGRVQVHDERGYGVLRDLLAGPPMWMNDDF